MPDNNIDIQTSATMELGNALQGLRQLTKGLNEVAEASKKLEKMQEDLQKKTGRTYAEIGKLAGRIPGAGGLKDIFDSASSGDAIFGRLAAGLGVAAIAFKAYELSVERNIDRAKKYVDAQNQVLGVTYKIKDAQTQAGAEGRGQNTEGYRFLVGAAGQKGIEAAQGLQNTGNFTRDQSIEIAGKLFARFGTEGGKAQLAINAVAAGAERGLDGAQLADVFAKNGNPTKEALLYLLKMEYWKKSQRIGGGSFDTPFDKAGMNVLEDPFLLATAQQARQGQGINAAERANTIKFGARAEGEAAAAAQNPGLQLIIDQFRQNSINDQNMLIEARAGNRYLQAIADAWAPGGSMWTQLDRIHSARWAAGE